MAGGADLGTAIKGLLFPAQPAGYGFVLPDRAAFTATSFPSITRIV